MKKIRNSLRIVPIVAAIIFLGIMAVVYFYAPMPYNWIFPVVLIVLALFIWLGPKMFKSENK